ATLCPAKELAFELNSTSTSFKKGDFKMKRLVLFVFVLVFVLANTVMAVDNSTAITAKNAANNDVKKAAKPQIQKAPTLKPEISLKERPAFTMTCPNSNEVSLNIFYTDTGWIINPNQLQPDVFTRAYASIDSNDKTKVTLACLYHAATDYMAKTSYNGLQKCYCNPSTGEGMIEYKGPEGYKMNIAGTSHAGYLPVKKTGENIQNQMLECQFHLDGQAQLFKVYRAQSNLSACQAKGREVTCQY
ncbi:MAG: hypothetical protein NTW65_06885, partial [Deltaproteobacteria bacterium]|nr:hypothetical protein [Deltaproteobacteria bacterium]